MNPLAQSLNEQLQQSNATAFAMLSDLGQNMFYPKGILSQSAEAKSTTYNATIGMATNKDGKMFASSLDAMFNDLTPDEIFPYAPPQGIEELRVTTNCYECINTWFIFSWRFICKSR